MKRCPELVVEWLHFFSSETKKLQPFLLFFDAFLFLLTNNFSVSRSKQDAEPEGSLLV